MKTIPLVQATLKGFVRNWQSVLLLIVFPLLLITSVFLSFNPDGLRPVPVGIVINTPAFALDEFEPHVDSFLSLTPYEDIGTCLVDLRLYHQYVCIDVTFDTAFVMTVHYDNTREPVIWEIIERIKTAVQLIQKERSKEMASGFLDKFSLTMGKVEVFKQDLRDTNSMIGSYVDKTKDIENDLQDAKSDLSSTLNKLDDDLDDAKDSSRDVRAEKNSMYSEANMYFMYANNYRYSFNNLTSYDQSILNNVYRQIDEAQDTVEDYNSQANSELTELDAKLYSYEQEVDRGRNYVYDMNVGISELQRIRSDLQLYQNRVLSAEQDLTSIQKEFQSIQGLDAELLVNPVVIRNSPVYLPSIDEEFIPDNITTEDVVRGVNLISLQTIFPLILLLIVFFLSLLISSYICLNHINSDAHERIRTISNISWHEFASVFISSVIIIAVPLFCVFLLGDLVFQLPLFAHFFSVSLIILMLSSIFILFGIALSYLVKQESVALLITTFILVFLIFISGFVLPVERMSSGAYVLATYSPGRTALSMFSKVVFYDQGIGMLGGELGIMTAWLFFSLIAALLIKTVRNT